MGRPSTFAEFLAAEICDRLADGEPLRAICRDDHMPSWRTVYDWMNAHPAFSARIAQARDLGADAIAEDTINLIDTPPERIETQFGDKIDVGHVQWQKNRVEQRLKLLAKWSPKKYGDRQAIDMSGNLGVNSMSEDEIKAELATLVALSGPPAADDASDLI